ncbi:hypothetical protein CspeluHIS016_0206700 [Cutaneotrichosporon spelunceum]|uniref:OPT-domain-containing protein n=1 Tax=Cutaneotrichosporon spelunceum TaxID=1672016 RepID=A0AAD3YBB8_9TREE|nr:hypothetical protein CspeluHIS016_0206700 [Cutaneotrichosporon spelunceum]
MPTIQVYEVDPASEKSPDGTEGVPNVLNDEKKKAGVKVGVYDAKAVVDEEIAEQQAKILGIEATAAELADAEEKISSMSLDRCKAIMAEIRRMHQYDQNFPSHTLDNINELLDNPDVTSNLENHGALIYAMKLEAVLVTGNSPYAEVRAVVDSTDDLSMPSLTFRTWFIGCLFSAIGAFINELFANRNPPISVSSDVAQVLAYPLGKFMERVLPRRQFTLFGRTFSLNPGRFNQKEHMLITMMCTIAFSTPYSGYIVFVQALPQYFNQRYARQFGYQITNTLGAQFIARLRSCRSEPPLPGVPQFLPTSLSTLALNTAFHADDHHPVPGPFKRVYAWTRLRFFYVMMAGMFIWFWIPGYLFEALMVPNWMTWIAPQNQALAAITGHRTGLGIDPISTFEWSWGTATTTPLVTPLFSILNQFFGFCVAGIMILGIYYTNSYNTGYLPINTNRTYDNRGKGFNVSRIVDKYGKMDNAKFQQYSEPWLAAGNIVIYFWFFAVYTAMVSYTILYHRHELAVSSRSMWRQIKKSFRRGPQPDVEEEDDLTEDIHWRLMKHYPEVPEWWYFIVLIVALGIGIAGVEAYPTQVTPAVVPYGVLLALIFMIPIGLIYAVTGQQVTLNVIAEFVGASIVPGDALAMNYFKMYGYITAAHALAFSKDLKLAHYTKINPRHTFWAQMVATLISAFACTALFNFLLGFKNICTNDATFNMTCPGTNTFFTASVFWGSYGPLKLFGPEGHYKTLLIGFPVGLVLPFITFVLTRKVKSKFVRSLHPVAMTYGALSWAPYNMSHQLPGVIMTYISWVIIKPRFLAFWARYNYVLYSAFVTGVAISAIVVFFALQVPEVSLTWWGNTVPYTGCDHKGCVRMNVPEIGYFGPAPGTFK